ncbi:myosin light chain kinase 2, skeletal/cardiac muscle [Anguilla anguilla]|uniref:myosin light chain kinase 2, skeletal/cardiac muscle n=1 Tax=Anguilla anguilla TaxID=7936 RepID=UPI0015A9D20D|nr:myosin light chain kinase 2, skeletal/cardiac muscle [Anguilla anguilla]
MCTARASGVPLRGLVALEAKLDSFGHKLDLVLSSSQLPARASGCAFCSTCSLHAAQQEAIVSMLSAQAHRLDSLERLVPGVGSEGGALPTQEGGVTPSQEGRAIPQKPLSLPVQNSCREAKEGTVNTAEKRNQTLKQQNICVTRQKGVPAQLKNDVRKDKAMSVEKALSPPPDRGSKPKFNPTVPCLTQPAPSLNSMGGMQKTNPPKTGLPDHEPPQQTRTGAQKNDGSGASGTLSCTSVGGATEQQVKDGRSDPGGSSSFKLPGQFHTEKAKPKVTMTPPPPSSEAKAVTTSTAGGGAAPSLPQGKLLAVTVPKATTNDSHSSLRHVHSCPESLQRLQDSGGSSRLNPSDIAAPPLPKTCSAAAGVPAVPVKPSAAAGIQITVSTAPDCTLLPDTTKATPPICQKILDDDPPHPAPFPHRVVTVRPSQPHDAYIINTQEILGGGRFGTVHSCTEKTSGLTLAAKIVITRSAKEKASDMSHNEIQVMNQLSHPNIIQLYDAYEVKNQVVLILEFVEGGELFERILDESFPLTELDAMIFVKQICEGIQYMHQMYVLHLDLKPENILCVNRSGHQVKIIDFGLARRYKPREKLRVSFGTPEFLAPEIVNFDFVSFPTDMWTVGVITYMLLSGLSPFMGDDDTQTLNNVLSVNWYFDEEAFEHVSPQAKDFVSNLLIRERSGRLSAAQCLRHSWLHSIHDRARHSNVLLKSQVQLRKYMAKRKWKKNYIAIAAANRFKKISSSGSLTSLAI